MRINQFLARSGLGSRRKVEELIESGKVKVNGEVRTDFFTRVGPEDSIEVEGKRIELADLKYYLLNKPAGFTVSKKDPHAEKTVFELLPPDETLFSVGRLDRETKGLLIITNDGYFGQNLIHPSKKIEKEYLVVAKNPITKEDQAKLLSGVEIEGGTAKAVKLEQLDPSKIMITVEEGRNRLIRRMLQAIENEVVELTRTRLGSFTLDVKEGEWRELTKEERAQYGA